MRLVAIPHARVVGLILFFKNNEIVWETLKMRHPPYKGHVRNRSHFGENEKNIGEVKNAKNSYLEL